MSEIKVLTVEDEILTAKTIQLYLEEKGMIFVGNAVTYEEAVSMIETREIDVVILDIRLYGSRSGIDLARYLSVTKPDLPVIFLTSQHDTQTLENAIELRPSSYLSKPIRKETLWTNIELAFNKKNKQSPLHQTIIIHDGNVRHRVREQDIKYIEADHVYIKITTTGTKPIISRASLASFIEQLSSDLFVRCHRSFIVNTQFIESWTQSELKVAGQVVPLSRSNRKAVFKHLEEKKKTQG